MMTLIFWCVFFCSFFHRCRICDRMISSSNNSNNRNSSRSNRSRNSSNRIFVHFAKIMVNPKTSTNRMFYASIGVPYNVHAYGSTLAKNAVQLVIMLIPFDTVHLPKIRLPANRCTAANTHAHTGHNTHFTIIWCRY